MIKHNMIATTYLFPPPQEFDKKKFNYTIAIFLSIA
jgi:hypothetical protein